MAVDIFECTEWIGLEDAEFWYLVILENDLVVLHFRGSQFHEEEVKKLYPDHVMHKTRLNMNRGVFSQPDDEIPERLYKILGEWGGGWKDG